MSQDQNETKRKLRDAAEKAKATGLNREQRRALQRATGVVKKQPGVKTPPKKVRRTLPGSKHPAPYRVNLDTPHTEGIPEKPKTKDELEKGWDSPPPKTIWKTPKKSSEVE